jgi:hypothetical protein
MIDFKDLQEGETISIGERLQPCAENYVLANAPLDGSRQFVFGIAVAHQLARTHSALHPILELRWTTPQLRLSLGADYPKRKQVLEYLRIIIEDLMCRPLTRRIKSHINL